MKNNTICGSFRYETPALDCREIAVEKGFADSGETDINSLPFGDAPDYGEGVSL